MYNIKKKSDKASLLQVQTLMEKVPNFIGGELNITMASNPCSQIEINPIILSYMSQDLYKLEVQPSRTKNE